MDRTPLLPSSVLAQIDALLIDPRGSFSPQPIALCRAPDFATAQVVTLVTVHDDGALVVVLAEPLALEETCWVEKSTHSDHAQPGPYLVSEVREGNRPEDTHALCWIHVLRPDPWADTVALT
ncbi:MAG: hypothetical protein HKL99_14660 [Burkholderiales bacterium]|jgi:hypothetical protein|nr:hypothetical protein [Burkholderiales bacterium]